MAVTGLPPWAAESADQSPSGRFHFAVAARWQARRLLFRSGRAARAWIQTLQRWRSPQSTALRWADQAADSPVSAAQVMWRVFTAAKSRPAFFAPNPSVLGMLGSAEVTVEFRNAVRTKEFGNLQPRAELPGGRHPAVHRLQR